MSKGSPRTRHPECSEAAVCANHNHTMPCGCMLCLDCMCMDQPAPASAPAATAEPTNCQQEPAYPGAETVVLSVRDPEMTAHLPSSRCSVQAPHRVTECGEFRVETKPVLAELHRHLTAYRAAVVGAERNADAGVDAAEWDAVNALEIFVTALVDPENQPHQWTPASAPAATAEPENPRCGSQGVDDDGLCVRCGLVPSDAADLDDDANNCPPGFLTRPAAPTGEEARIQPDRAEWLRAQAQHVRASAATDPLALASGLHATAAYVEGLHSALTAQATELAALRALLQRVVEPHDGQSHAELCTEIRAALTPHHGCMARAAGTGERTMTTVREHLDALGFTGADHDANVREALLELRHARLSLIELRKREQEEGCGDGER